MHNDGRCRSTEPGSEDQGIDHDEREARPARTPEEGLGGEVQAEQRRVVGERQDEVCAPARAHGAGKHAQAGLTVEGQTASDAGEDRGRRRAPRCSSW